jgi:hypothetical protein
LINEEWYVEDFQWGIASQVIFQALSAEQWRDFLTMIKTLLSYLERDLKWENYLTF